MSTSFAKIFCMTPKRRITIAEIKELMRLKGWTQAELARQLDEMDRSTIHYWLIGERRPNRFVAKIMHAMLAEARQAEPLPA